MSNQRAAVVVGVDKPNGLAPLTSAASNAAKVAEWLESVEPGYDVSLLTDKDLPVEYSQIESEILKYASLPTRYKFLLVYFSGHGLYQARTDIWLLSKSPTRPREAVDLTRAIGLAKYCGIPNVTFISDACRSLPADIAQAHLEPGGLFPTHREILNSTSKVDSFRATGRGTSAYEATIGDERASFLTHALRKAYRNPDAGMVQPVKVRTKTFQVVPNRRLEAFIQDTVDQAIAGVDNRLSQQIEVSVPSDDLIFIAPADEINAEVGPASGHEPTGKLPLTVSIAAPRAGIRNNLKQLTGIGPAREAAFNDIGVFHLEQIAQMSVQDRKWLNDAGHSLKGLAEKYRWEDEAANTLRNKKLAREDTFARATARRVEAALTPGSVPMPQDGAMSVRIETALDARRPVSDRISLETPTGLQVQGARIDEVIVGRPEGSETAEILESGNGKAEPGIIRLSGIQRGASVAVRFADGRSILVPSLDEYIGHAHIDEAGMKTLNYVPSVNTSRYYDYERKKNSIDNLRAAVALASEHGTFRVGSERGARSIASHVRMEKASDPTLGVYAAHAYWEASDDDAVKSIRSYMWSDLQVDLFDVWMLSSRWPEKDRHQSMFPGCPLLTQGWSLLAMKDIHLPEPLHSMKERLTNALWTTFQAGAFDELKLGLERGDIQ